MQNNIGTGKVKLEIVCKTSAGSKTLEVLSKSPPLSNAKAGITFKKS